MAHKTEDGRWRVHLRVNGRRHSKNFRTKGEAERYEAFVRHGIEQGPASAGHRAEKKANFDSPTFSAFAERWLEDYCRLEKAPSQLLIDSRVIRRDLNPAFGDRPLDQLTKADLQKLRGELARRLRPKTVNNIVGLAKRILAVAVDWDLLKASPWTGVKPMPLDGQSAAFWTPDERDRFLARAKDIGHGKALSAIVEVACHTGLRRSELAALRWEQLDFDRRLIRVDAMFCFATNQRLARTKNREVAYVPMNEAAYRVLSGIVRKGPDVFDREELRHASARLKRLCIRLGISPIRFHDLRHTFGSNLAMAGIELSQRQRLMRHKTVAMTDRYTHLLPEFLRAAVESIAKTPGTDLAPVPPSSPASLQDSSRILEPQTGFEPHPGTKLTLVKTSA